MNNLSLESYYVAVFKYYAFDHLSFDIFAGFSSFSSISGKIEEGSAVQKLEEKSFPVKIWIIVKKIWLSQQKMNGNDAIIFYILKEQLNSFQTSGNGF